MSNFGSTNSDLPERKITLQKKDKEYDIMTKKASPPSPKIKNSLFAFIIGGAICSFGELLRLIFESLAIKEDNIKILIPCTLVVITAILTGIGVFDKIAKHAGAGTIVPITGFANAVVSAGLEFSSEGYILGVGANLFKIAGPVIVYGTASSVIYGVIYWVIQTI